MGKKKIKLYKKNLKKYIVKCKKIIIIILMAILFVSIPPCVNFLISTEAFICPSFFGFITVENKEAWIGFFGALIGGTETLLGVAWTIIDQNKKRQEDVKDLAKPVLVAQECDYEKICKINGDNNTKVFECRLSYKNVGRGILFNPRVFNIDYKIDDKNIGKLNPTFSESSFLNINDTSSNIMMIIFDLDALNEIHKVLDGRGNTLLLQITMYVGGKDMYGRDVATKLNYKKELSFFPENEIKSSLQKGELTSVVIFEEDEICEIVNKANIKYNPHL